MMKTGDFIKGFEVTNIRRSDELGGFVVEMVHQKTGARLVWTDNKELNKVFAIGFKTLPQDDTGVFHILEHSVLNGSRELPVKTLFVELMKGSLNTFLNAMTSPDKTVFPVASCNDADFMNLVKLYLSSTLFPQVLDNRNIFLQEGWHFETDESLPPEGGFPPEGCLTPMEAVPTINGVVYNEMKGDFSSPDSQLMRQISAALFPDNSYGFTAGGDPRVIPELSYEELKMAHSKHYHPSNACVYLDGDVDLPAVLELIDSYFDRFEKRDEKIDFVHQNPHPPVLVSDTYAAMDVSEGAMLGLANFLPEGVSFEELNVYGMLMSYLTAGNESEITKPIVDAGIAYGVSGFVDDNNPQPYAMIQLQQMDPERKEDAKRIIRETLKDLASNGINEAKLLASIDQLEYRVKDIPEPAGLARMEQAFSSWLYGRDALQQMCYMPVLEKMRESVTSGDYKRLLAALNFDDGVEVFLQASETKEEEIAQEEAAYLEKRAAAMTAAELAQIREDQAALEAWQSTPGPEELLAQIPTLALSDIDIKPSRMTHAVTEAFGRPVLLHTANANGLTHVHLYFSMGACSLDEMQDLSFLTNVFGELPTHRHDAAQLDQLFRQYVGDADYNVVPYGIKGHPEQCRPVFEVSFSCLSKHERKALALLREILLETDYTSEHSLEIQYQTLMQGQMMLLQNIMGEGSYYAMRRAGSHLNAADRIGELVEGYDFYKWLTNYVESFEETSMERAARYSALTQKVFRASGLTASVVSEEPETLREAVISAFARNQEDSAVAQNLDDTPVPGNTQPDVCDGIVSEILTLPLDPEPVKEFIPVPSMVAYAASSGYSKQLLQQYRGSAQALSQALNFDFLWDRIRVHGGAYGCSCSVSSYGMIGFSSYRDPDPFTSIETYREAPEFIEKFVRQEEPLDKYIIGAFGEIDPLLGVKGQGKRGDDDYFFNITPEKRADRQRELLQATHEELASFKECFAIPMASCIIGSEELLTEELKKDWRII